MRTTIFVSLVSLVILGICMADEVANNTQTRTGTSPIISTAPISGSSLSATVGDVSGVGNAGFNGTLVLGGQNPGVTNSWSIYSASTSNAYLAADWIIKGGSQAVSPRIIVAGSNELTNGLVVAKYTSGYSGSTQITFVSNTVAETTLFSATSDKGGARIFSGDDTLFYGSQSRTLRVTATGYISTAASAPTLQIRYYHGGTTLLIADTGAQTLPANLTNEWWKVDMMVYCNDRLKAIGYGAFSYTDGSQNLKTLKMISSTAPNSLVLGQTNLNLTATWGTANATNSIVTGVSSIEILN